MCLWVCARSLIRFFLSYTHSIKCVRDGKNKQNARTATTNKKTAVAQGDCVWIELFLALPAISGKNEKCILCCLCAIHSVIYTLAHHFDRLELMWNARQWKIQNIAAYTTAMHCIWQFLSMNTSRNAPWRNFDDENLISILRILWKWHSSTVNGGKKWPPHYKILYSMKRQSIME